MKKDNLSNFIIKNEKTILANKNKKFNGYDRINIIANNTTLGSYEYVAGARKIKDISKIIIDSEKIKNFVEKLPKCGFCLEIISEPQNLKSCSHGFCKKCFINNIIKTKQCPICRNTFQNKRQSRPYQLLNDILQLFGKHIDLFKEEEERNFHNNFNKFVFNPDNINIVKKEIEQKNNISENKNVINPIKSYVPRNLMNEDKFSNKTNNKDNLIMLGNKIPRPIIKSSQKISSNEDIELIKLKKKFNQLNVIDLKEKEYDINEFSDLIAIKLQFSKDKIENKNSVINQEIVANEETEKKINQFLKNQKMFMPSFTTIADISIIIRYVLESTKLLIVEKLNFFIKYRENFIMKQEHVQENFEIKEIKSLINPQIDEEIILYFNL